MLIGCGSLFDEAQWFSESKGYAGYPGIFKMGLLRRNRERRFRDLENVRNQNPFFFPGWVGEMKTSKFCSTEGKGREKASWGLRKTVGSLRGSSIWQERILLSSG